MQHLRARQLLAVDRKAQPRHRLVEQPHPGGTADDAAVKREDGVAELVLVDDEDGDDTADQDVTTTGTSWASRGTRTGGAGTATGTVRQQQAPRDNFISNEDSTCLAGAIVRPNELGNVDKVR